MSTESASMDMDTPTSKPTQEDTLRIPDNEGF